MACVARTEANEGPRQSDHLSVAIDEFELEQHVCHLVVPMVGGVLSAWGQEVEGAKGAAATELDAVEVCVPCAVLGLVCDPQVDGCAVVAHISKVDLVRCGCVLNLFAALKVHTTTTNASKIGAEQRRVEVAAKRRERD